MTKGVNQREYDPHISSVHALLQKLENITSSGESSLLVTVLDNAPIGFAYLDRNFRYRVINRTLAQINGLPIMDHLGKTMAELFPRLNKIVYPHLRQVMAKGKPVLDLELTGHGRYQPDKNRFWRVSIYPIRSNSRKIMGLGVILNDITEQKEYEQFREDFFHMASHEIKNPLTSVKAYAHLLEVNLRRKRDRKNADMAARVENSADKINYLINTFMNVSKLEAGNMLHKCTECAIDDLVAETAADFRYAPTHHRVLVEGKTGCRVYVDQERIEEVLNNLISNAIKYSPGKDRVIVTLEKKEKEVVVAVRDFGVGIPPEKTQLVFDKFYRGESASANRDGLGLGLYISAQIIRYYKGRIWVDSTVGKGSTFFFSLPEHRS